MASAPATRWLRSTHLPLGTLSLLPLRLLLPGGRLTGSPQCDLAGGGRSFFRDPPAGDARRRLDFGGRIFRVPFAKIFSGSRNQQVFQCISPWKKLQKFRFAPSGNCHCNRGIMKRGSFAGSQPRGLTMLKSTIAVALALADAPFRSIHTTRRTRSSKVTIRPSMTGRPRCSML